MSLAVLDRGARLTFSFDDLMRYHGPSSPGGVAHAYKGARARAAAARGPAGAA
jgi:hypothetical protein